MSFIDQGLEAERFFRDVALRVSACRGGGPAMVYPADAGTALRCGGSQVRVRPHEGEEALHVPRHGRRALADVHRLCLLAHFRLCERATGPHVRPGAHFAYEIPLHRA